MINWNVFFQLLLPIRLRTAKLLVALLSALTKVTRSRFDSDFVWVQNLIKELKYTSQVKSMVQLLNDEFDPINRSIIILDGTEANVTFWGVVSPDIVIAGETENIEFITPDELSTVGVDFVVKVPLYVNKDVVSTFIRRYIFAGVAFEIENL